MHKVINGVGLVEEEVVLCPLAKHAPQINKNRLATMEISLNAYLAKERRRTGGLAESDVIRKSTSCQLSL